MGIKRREKKIVHGSDRSFSWRRTGKKLRGYSFKNIWFYNVIVTVIDNNYL